MNIECVCVRVWMEITCKETLVIDIYAKVVFYGQNCILKEGGGGGDN